MQIESPYIHLRSSFICFLSQKKKKKTSRVLPYDLTTFKQHSHLTNERTEEALSLVRTIISPRCPWCHAKKTSPFLNSTVKIMLPIVRRPSMGRFCCSFPHYPDLPTRVSIRCAILWSQITAPKRGEDSSRIMKDERRAPLGGDEGVFQLVAMDGVDKEDITTITYGLICGTYRKKNSTKKRNDRIG